MSAEEARARLERYGANSVEQAEHSLVREILGHFWGPIPWMIEAALVLTGATGRWTDFGIILALLLLNGAVGFWEEHQAQSAIAALKRRLAVDVTAHRDGSWTNVPAVQVVPGDLVRVRAGNIVPADGHVAAGGGAADESALTGESLPVEKEPGDGAYSGTVISRGAPVVRVCATGAHTEFGRIAELAGAEARESHFQRAIVDIGKYLIIVAIALVGVIVAVSLVRGTSLTHTLEFALVVTIASIPVALPAVLSVTMAVGARSLAKREAVVRHLPAVEEMAGVDVLCVDKTGTLTKNQLAVARVEHLDGYTDEDVLLNAALTTDPDAEDPIDRAILQAVSADRRQGWETVELHPFDPTRKRADARLRGPRGEQIGVAKGAVQAILDLAGTDPEGEKQVWQVTKDLARRGYRALAVARTLDEAWRVTGVLGLQDPARDDSKQTLAEAARLGLDIKMVTGDRVEIAREIARAVGIGDDVLEAEAMHRLRGAALADKAEQADGFAQVVPEDKYRIVEALQDHGHIVGMTGDGVNDVAALHRADAGIAVSGATEAAQAAADIVLLAPGLSTIVEAVHRAREVFRRMKNYAIYRITETLRIVAFVTVTIVVFGFFPITPIQVVLLAILNDAAILTIAYDRVRASGRPERWDLTEVLVIAATLGFFGVVSTFGLVWIAHGPLALTDAVVPTLVYLKLSVSGHFTVFLARTRGPFWSYRPAWVLLGAVVGTQLVATLIAVSGLLMQPVGWGLVALAWGWATVEFLLLDPAKLAAYKVLQRRGMAAEETG